MKRALLILVAGVLLGVLAGGSTYLVRTSPHRAMLRDSQPELAWLQHEFKLNDDEFERVATLHNAYLKQCAEMCERIAGTNQLVSRQIAADLAVTPEVERLLADSAALRVQCQKEMLAHFLEVSRTMPPEQGRRYLAWMEKRLFSMSHEAGARIESNQHHGH
ncbi:MAG TPA: periplasmic heavy metal sensor [Verrucomicrobiota bacterium]|nr:periplasmic heavy metal sensor [Verrucomicrobiota bacterium]